MLHCAPQECRKWYWAHLFAPQGNKLAKKCWSFGLTPQTFGAIWSNEMPSKGFGFGSKTKTGKLAEKFVFYSPISQLPLFFESSRLPFRTLREKQLFAAVSGPGGARSCHSVPIQQACRNCFGCGNCPCCHACCSEGISLRNGARRPVAGPYL